MRRETASPSAAARRCPSGRDPAGRHFERSPQWRCAVSISTLKGKQVDIHLWTPVHEVESSALDQLKNIAALPWVFHHVAVMPDVHFGKGATVGSVIAMKEAVSPAA